MKFSVFEVLKSATERLSADKIENPRLDAEILLANVLNCRRLDLYVDSNRILPIKSVLQFDKLVNQRLQKIPVAYIIGNKEFMGFSFAVNENVLIPRPETEILTEFVGNYLRGLCGEVLFADLGVGSGAISISILKFVKTALAFAVDISPDALEVAKFNANKFNVDDRINFFCGNLFEPLNGEIFDAIVSNPPYIPTNDIENLQAEVKSEPRIALDGGIDGLNFYRQIISDSPKFLVAGGLLAVEIGINQASAVKNLFESENFADVKILSDLSGIERVVAGIKRD